MDNFISKNGFSTYIYIHIIYYLLNPEESIRRTKPWFDSLHLADTSYLATPPLLTDSLTPQRPAAHLSPVGVRRVRERRRTPGVNTQYQQSISL